MIVEILSPSTERRDRLAKLRLYQKAGVREYWIVSPTCQIVEVFCFSDGLLLPKEVYGREDIAEVSVLEGCLIDLSKVFHTEGRVFEL